MTDLIRSACLMQYPEVARSVGIEAKKLVRKVRLPLACLDRPDLRIAVASVRRLLEASAVASGIDEFGLRMADQGGLATLGPVALLVREQATVGTALEALARFIHVHHEGMHIKIEHDDDVVMVDVALRGRPRPQRQSTEMAIGSVHRVLHALFGGDWRPLEVHLTHSPPRNRGYYQTFFGCNVIFNSERDAILLPARDLDHPIRTAHPLIARYLQKRVEAIDTRRKNWDDRVAELVRSLLSGGKCTIDRVAEHLACNRRTIHRHLADCGTTFSAILDAQRADLVVRLIEDDTRPLNGIAELLGFSTQSAMARWFRGRFGCSITQWRTDGRHKTTAATGRW